MWPGEQHGAVVSIATAPCGFSGPPTFGMTNQPTTENRTMIATLGTLEEAAKELVGNWQEFDCFLLGSLQRD